MKLWIFSGLILSTNALAGANPLNTDPQVFSFMNNIKGKAVSCETAERPSSRLLEAQPAKFHFTLRFQDGNGNKNDLFGITQSKITDPMTSVKTQIPVTIDVATVFKGTLFLRYITSENNLAVIAFYLGKAGKVGAVVAGRTLQVWFKGLYSERIAGVESTVHVPLVCKLD